MTIATHAAAAVIAAGLAVASTAAFLNPRHDAALSKQVAYAERLSADYSNQIATLAEDARQAEAAARAEEQRRAVVHREAIDAAKEETEIARADAGAFAVAAAGLRRAVDELNTTETARHRASTSNTAASGRSTGEQNSGALDLLSDVLWRVGDATGEISAYADRLRIAGLTCERIADGVWGDQR